MKMTIPEHKIRNGLWKKKIKEKVIEVPDKYLKQSSNHRMRIQLKEMHGD